MKSASGKRPPDEAHGSGKEAIRPQQRCLGKPRKEGAHGRAALPEEVRTTLIQKIKPVTQGTAPHSKILLNFVKHFRMFAVLVFFLKTLCICLVAAPMVQNSQILINLFWNFNNILVLKVSKYPRF